MKTHRWIAPACVLAFLSLSALADRPNIVLILVDDMGFSDLGCYGSEIQTPNLDRLARNGVRFTQFYNTAKCFPSRACLLTGVYAQQCGMDRGPGAFKNCTTLGEVLRDAGYRTLWTGKHHGTDNPVDIGFDRYFGLRDGACNHFNPGEKREGEPEPARKTTRHWCIDDQHFHPYTPKEKDFYTTDYFTRYALQYLEEYRDEKKPFFLYLAYTAPHDPMMAWPVDIAKYRGTYKTGYEQVRQARWKRQQDMKLFQDNATLSPRQSPDWNSLSPEQQDEADLRMAVYAAMVDRVDQNVGKVLRAIEARGELDNTLILFCSDNGASAEVVRKGSGEIGTLSRWASQKGDWANVSNTPFRRFKNYSHEGGVCTSMIAHWPKGVNIAGSICRYPGHFVDVMATFIDAAGATYPATSRGRPVASLQGKSLLPLLRGESMPEREPIFWQWSQGKAVRKGKWKLVGWGKKSPWELYDIEQDRTELNDLSQSHPETVRELGALWDDWQTRCANAVPQ